MTEVKRYHLTETGLVEGESLGRLSVVLAADFDRVTAERDAALGQLKEKREEFNKLGDRYDALQQRLTAADERADVLEGLLREAAKDDDGEYSLGSDWHDRCRAALKPAEGGGDDA